MRAAAIMKATTNSMAASARAVSVADFAKLRDDVQKRGLAAKAAG
jgi:hypothetical protein